jgi:hypothetical protein
VFFSLGIERQILAEVDKCNCIETLKKIASSLSEEPNAKFYRYAIGKINEKIA